MKELPDYFMTPNRFMAECQRQSMTGQYGGSVGYMLEQYEQPEYIPAENDSMEAFETAKILMRERAFNDAKLKGFIAEYGVADGTSFLPLCNTAQNPICDQVFGFDAFEGLEDNGKWRGNMIHQDEFKYDGNIPFEIPFNGVITKGWFTQTLPNFNYKHDSAKFINLDCDTYDASAYVLNHLLPYIKTGTVIALDDYFCQYAYKTNSQFTAWEQFVTAHRIVYEYIYCCAPAVVVKLIHVPLDISHT